MNRFGQIRSRACLRRVGFCGAGAAFLNFWPSFGGAVVGERLARAKTSPQFRDGHFENVVPKTPRTTAQSLGLSQAANPRR